MSRGKIPKRVTKIARYYRCRTTACATGQVAARNVESFLSQKLFAHKSTFEPAVHAKLREVRHIWSRLIPADRCKLLIETFTFAWRAKTSQLILRLKDDDEGAPDG